MDHLFTAAKGDAWFEASTAEIAAIIGASIKKQKNHSLAGVDGAVLKKSLQSAALTFGKVGMTAESAEVLAWSLHVLSYLTHSAEAITEELKKTTEVPQSVEFRFIEYLAELSASVALAAECVAELARGLKGADRFAACGRATQALLETSSSLSIFFSARQVLGDKDTALWAQVLQQFAALSPAKIQSSGLLRSIGVTTL